MDLGSEFDKDDRERLEALREKREKAQLAAKATQAARNQLAEACEAVQGYIASAEADRQRLAVIYAACESMDSPVEIEVGNVIAKLRKSIEQARKSMKVLLQPPLPMKD